MYFFIDSNRECCDEDEHVYDCLIVMYDCIEGSPHC